MKLIFTHNQHKAKSLIKLIAFYLLLNTGNPQILNKKITKAHLAAVITDLKYLNQISKFRVENNREYFYIFYTDTSTIPQYKVTTVRLLNTPSVVLVDSTGADVTTLVSSPTQKVDQTTFGYHSASLGSTVQGRTVKPQFTATLNQATGVIKLYSETLAEHPDTSLQTLLTPVFLSKDSVSDTGNIYFAFLEVDTLKQIKIPISNPTTLIFAAFPSTGVTEIIKFSSSTLGTTAIIYSVKGTSMSKVFYANLVSTNPTITEVDHQEVRLQADGSSLTCRYVYSVDPTNFICANDSSQLTQYSISGIGTRSVTVTKTTLPTAATYSEYKGFTELTGTGSVSSSEGKILYAFIKKGSDYGIAMLKKSTLEELYFYELTETLNTNLINYDTILYINYLNSGSVTADPYIFYLDFLNFSGVEKCQTNTQNTNGLFSYKCSECISPEYLDTVANDPKDKCVEDSYCTKGIQKNNPNLCHTLNSCTDTNCIKCVDFDTSKLKCSECISPMIPNASTAVCENCQTHESYQSDEKKCYDCRTDNHCINCEDITKNCNQCEKGYELKASETKSCTKICPNNNNFYREIITDFSSSECVDCKTTHFCDDCGYNTFICNSCSFGYKNVVPKPTVETQPLCEKECPNSNDYFDGSCKSCLTLNNCPSCKYPSGECLACSTTKEVVDPIDNKKCSKCSDLISNCDECDSPTSCTLCVDGFHPVAGSCVENCPAPDKSAITGTFNCFDCSLNLCSQCDNFSQQCQVCQQIYLKVDPADNTKCIPKCPEIWSSWNEASGSCVDCKLNQCDECDELTQKCTKCKSGFKLDPHDLEEKICIEINSIIDICPVDENCLECFLLTSDKFCEKCKEKYIVSEDKTKCVEDFSKFRFINFEHKFQNTETLSDLSLRVSLAYTNGTGVENDEIFEKRKNIFRVKEVKTKTELKSYTTFDEHRSIYTFVNFTKDLLDDKGYLEVELTLLEHTSIDSIPFLNKTENLKVKPNKKNENLNSVSNIASQATTESPLIFGTLATVDPTGVVMKVSQYMTLLNRLVFLNIDFGEKLTPLLEQTAKVEKIQPKNRLMVEEKYFEIQESSKGKFDKYFVGLEFEGKLFWYVVVYLFSWTFKIMELILLKRIGLKKIIKKIDRVFLKIVRKLKMTIFGICSTTIVFFGFRIVFHRKKAYVAKLILTLAMSLILVDLILIYKNIENLLFIQKLKENEKLLVNEKNGKNLREEKNLDQMQESIQVLNLCSEDEEEKEVENKNYEILIVKPKFKELTLNNDIKREDLENKNKLIIPSHLDLNDNSKSPNVYLDSENEDNDNSKLEHKPKNREKKRNRRRKSHLENPNQEIKSKRSKRRKHKKEEENEKKNSKKEKKRKRNRNRVRPSEPSITPPPYPGHLPQLPQNRSLSLRQKEQSPSSNFKTENEKKRKNEEKNQKILKTKNLIFEKEYQEIRLLNSALIAFNTTDINIENLNDKSTSLYFLTNLSFTIRILISQVTLVSLPQNPELQLFILIANELIYLAMNIFTYIKMKSLKHWVMFLSRVLQSLSLLTLFFIFWILLRENRENEDETLALQGIGVIVLWAGVFLDIGFNVACLGVNLYEIYKKKKNKNGDFEKNKEKK